jgi:hypothetical protein
MTLDVLDSTRPIPSSRAFEATAVNADVWMRRTGPVKSVTRREPESKERRADINPELDVIPSAL